MKVEDARKTALKAANEALEKRKTQITAAWDELKKQIDLYQDQSKKLLAGNGDSAEQAPPKAQSPAQPRTYDAANPPSDQDMAAALRNANVTRLGLLIQTELGRYDADRNDALEKYDAAYNLIKEAQGLDDQAAKGLPKAVSEKEVAKALAELYGPNGFKLQMASIQLKKAQVHAEQADTVSVLDDTRSALSAALEKAGLELPGEFSKLPTASTVADLRKQSDDEYTQADTMLDEVAQGGSQTDQTSARELQVAERYARSKDAASAGDTAKAESELTTAKNILQTISPVPDSLYLAPELASVVRTARPLGPTSGPTAPGPVTTPPEAPATAPATPAPETGTPATAPAAPDTGTTPSTQATAPSPDAGTTPTTAPAPATPDAPK